MILYDFIATAKIVFNADLQVFDNPTEETEQFIGAIKLIFDCIFKVVVEPPFFKLYPNKVYRDLKKGFTVRNNYCNFELLAFCITILYAL